MMEQEYYYRWTNAITLDVCVHFWCDAYPVIKKTNKGVFIDDKGKKRFILNNAKTKWAYPNKQDAWIHYKYRSKYHLENLYHSVAKIKFAQSAPQFQFDEFPIEAFYEVQPSATLAF